MRVANIPRIAEIAPLTKRRIAGWIKRRRFFDDASNAAPTDLAMPVSDPSIRLPANGHQGSEREDLLGFEV